MEKPNEKMVSDITYVWTDEGWLYVAAIMDLCGQKIVGLSMNERMTKELVINALDDAYNRAGRPNGVILHSDRGSQYCSIDYQNLTKSITSFVVCHAKATAGIMPLWNHFGVK